MLAVSVITPSRSSRTASYRSRVIARVLAGSRVDRSPFVSLIVSSSPSVDLGILPNERHVPNPHGGYVPAITEGPIYQEMAAPPPPPRPSGPAAAGHRP